MVQNSTAEVCRLLVVGPTSQVDLSVPTHIPLSDLMPALLRGLGPDLADRGLEHSGWVLQRLGETPLDEDATVADHDLLDGETLYVRPRSDQLPPLDFDDLIDGVATGMRSRSGHWRPRNTRLAALAVLAAPLVTVLVVPLLGGRGGVGALGQGRAVALAVVAVVLAAVATVAGRLLRDAALAALVGTAGVAATVEAVLCALVDAGPGRAVPGPAGLLLVAAGVGTLVALALLAAVSGVEALLQVGTAVLTLALAAAVVSWLVSGAGLSWTATAAVALMLSVALRPAVPVLAFKLARMALPPLPVEPDELQEDIEPEPGAEVLARTAAADRYMTALHAACGVISGGALLRLAAAPGWVPATLVVLVALAQLLALRPMTSTWHRLALGLPACAGLLAALLFLVPRPGSFGDEVALWLALSLVPAGVAVTWVLARRRLTPMWGRAGDWAHTAALVLAVPLVVSVLGGISLVRAVVN
ncbi:type VII secretion integral membrane protein EccD [Parafrankia colletiae]|uniref:Type VII secretion integral membrane protein EccD n=1 Tax=Parafrankia colletiae TaxID=573497 RepID=A0A1S1QB86_9ACTN|nr:type VII secretion integral membrane protein EccD [Parafrankia colletiae]